MTKKQFTVSYEVRESYTVEAETEEEAYELVMNGEDMNPYQRDLIDGSTEVYEEERTPCEPSAE